jgi:hypothetical protein
MMQPLFAEILTTDEKSTYAVAWVFSKPVLRKYTGENHYKRACEWITSWQQHFDREWFFVKDVFTKTMDEFINVLSLHGVKSDMLLKVKKTILEHSVLYE